MPSSTACVNPAARISSAIYLKALAFRELFLDDPEPAEPLAFVGVGPKRRIARPETLDFVVGFPVFERGLHGLRQRLRQFVDHRLGEEPVANFACVSTAASSLSKASAKSFTPSSVS